VPTVRLAGNLCRTLAGGAEELEVSATTFRRLVAELEARFPGLGRQVSSSMAVAIDGVIYQDAYDAKLPEAAEIVLIPKISGG
jgi:molybdopterin converting factor small subunit